MAQGFPWWGRTHTAALEPWTSYPTNGLNEAIANGSALTLAAGEKVDATLVAVIYSGHERVTSISAEGEVFRASEAA